MRDELSCAVSISDRITYIFIFKTFFSLLIFGFPHLSLSVSLPSATAIMGQGISATQFFVKGKRSFTRTGYDKAVKAYSDPVQTSASIKRNEAGTDGVDLEGKVVLITGANSGIGKSMATYAAAKGANVYMICRSKERAEAARDEIQKETSSDKVNILLGDLSVLSQVKRVVTELKLREEKVDCLVCNAGLLLNERQENSEGREVTFACHLLGGSYYLSSLLLPQLKAAGSESRVVFVSSGGMYNEKFPTWEKATGFGKWKDKFDGQNAYVYAKRGQVLLAERFARDHPEVHWLSCHPGWTDTPAVELAYGASKKYLEPMRNTWEGAEGITWLFGKQKSALKNGAFYLDRRPQTKHIAGPFMTEGSYTKNTEVEVDEMMEKLRAACGL